MKTYQTVDALYDDLISTILNKGEQSGDRTGTGTRRLFGTAFKLAFKDNRLMVPIFKPVNIKAVGAELYCFINGITNVDTLKMLGCNWWEANLQDANKRWGTPDNRDLGPVYGAQWVKEYWKNGELTDQLQELVHTLKTNPTDRRMYVTAWNPQEMPSMALPPCYHGFQCFVNGANELELMFHMRSADVILGLPHDILLHQLLQIMLAAEVGCAIGDLTVTLGDYHIYENHVDASKQFLERIVENADEMYDTNARRRPSINAIYDKSIFNFRVDDLNGLMAEYTPMANIKLPMAV